MSTYPQVTTTAVAAEVLRLANASPEHIYRPVRGIGCVYVAGEHLSNDPTTGDDQRLNAPEGCLFGQAIGNLGVAAEDMRDWEGYPVEELLSNIGFTNDAEHLLAVFPAVQGAQDGGMQWGEAVLPLREAMS